ncbi:MAG: VOC family protein [Phycisphaerales bacterium]|nr:VOC family protein [Phycisphaerales bacterium]
MEALIGLAPMLLTRDMLATISFYCDVLGFTLDSQWPENEPCWCSLTNGMSRVMFTTQGYKAETPTMTGRLYFYTTNVMAIYERVKSRAKVIEGPEVYFYRMKEIAIEDCNGYVLAFGQDTDEAPTCQQE